jgi:hypothetical protein
MCKIRLVYNQGVFLLIEENDCAAIQSKFILLYRLFLKNSIYTLIWNHDYTELGCP